MLERIVEFIARFAGKERSTLMRLLSLAAGTFIFIVIVPLILGSAGHAFAEYVRIRIPKTLEMLFGVTGISVGTFFLLWSVKEFWFIGRGTPVPFASPTRLVTSGPFTYTRNPIKLGAILFYFGIGTLNDQLMTGLVMFALGALLGTFYHKVIEEKELTLRFGEKYEAYRRRTSFLFPLPPKTTR
jgi:protein-S-isoprenylcysteine O-methyltransferase Ste14